MLSKKTRWSLLTVSLLGVVLARPLPPSSSSEFLPPRLPFREVLQLLISLFRLSDKEEYKNAHFIKIDVDEIPELSAELGIRAMPTFLFFKNGEKVDEVVGAAPQKLEAGIKSLVA